MKSNLVKGSQSRGLEHRRPGHHHETHGKSSSAAVCDSRPDGASSKRAHLPYESELVAASCFRSSIGRAREMKDFCSGYVAAGTAVAAIAVLAYIVIF
jgi:hypothetical protein